MVKRKYLLIGLLLLISFTSVQSQGFRLKHEILFSGRLQIPFFKERQIEGASGNQEGIINGADNANCYDFENDGVPEFFTIQSPYLTNIQQTIINIYDGATCNLKYTVTIDSASPIGDPAFALSFMDVDGDNIKELVGEFSYPPTNPNMGIGLTRLLFIDVKSNKIKYTLNRYQLSISPDGYISYAFYDIDNDHYPEVICNWESDTILPGRLRIYGSGASGINSPGQPLAKQNTPLLKNMHNPFLGSAKLEYYVTGLDNVFLNIFDSEGRAIRTLVNKKQPMGEYYVIWDGKDNSGQPITAGQYYYQLKIGNFISTKKVIAFK